MLQTDLFVELASKLAQGNNQTNQMGNRSIGRNHPMQAYDQPPDIAQPEKCSLLFTGGYIAAVFNFFQFYPKKQISLKLQIDSRLRKKLAGLKRQISTYLRTYLKIDGIR